MNDMYNDFCEFEDDNTIEDVIATTDNWYNEKSVRAERRKRAIKKENKKKMTLVNANNSAFGRCLGVNEDGEYEMDKIHYTKKSYTKSLKHSTARIARKMDELPNGNAYKKIYGIEKNAS